MKKTVCIDFDGVIHSYTSPWAGPVVIEDPPVPGAFEFMSACLSAGFDVAIYSSRSSTHLGREAMKRWMSENGFGLTHHLSFPEHKPPAAIYLDDRAVQFKGEFPSMAFIQSFEPWNRKPVFRFPGKKTGYIGIGQRAINTRRPFHL